MLWFLYSSFLVLLGLRISWTKTPILPNLRLHMNHISSDYHTGWPWWLIAVINPPLREGLRHELVARRPHVGLRRQRQRPQRVGGRRRTVLLPGRQSQVLLHRTPGTRRPQFDSDTILLLPLSAFTLHEWLLGKWQICTVWGGNLFRRFCKMFSEIYTGCRAVLQLQCCPSKQGEFSENILQNLFHNLTPQSVQGVQNDLSFLCIRKGIVKHVVCEIPFCFQCR